jgi:hypothetical protein
MHFHRGDIASILRWFEDSLAANSETDAEDLVSLREGTRLYLKREGLPAFLRKVRDRELVPIDRAGHCPGIEGFRFRAGDMRRCKSWGTSDPPPIGTMSFQQAAMLIGTNCEVIRNLVDAKVFIVEKYQGPRGQRFIAAEDVDAFARKFIALASVAQTYKTTSRKILQGIDGRYFLRVELPGKGNKLFVERQAFDE